MRHVKVGTATCRIPEEDRRGGGATKDRGADDGPSSRALDTQGLSHESQGNHAGISANANTPRDTLHGCNT